MPVFRKFEFGDEATAMFQVAVLLDPLSEAAQKWSTLMEVRSPFILMGAGADGFLVANDVP